MSGFGGGVPGVPGVPVNGTAVAWGLGVVGWRAFADAGIGD